jgi:hypothetical protein
MLMTPVAHLVPQIDARLVWLCVALPWQRRRQPR